MATRLKKYFTGFWYAFPIQLLLLHFKRTQILLLFWWLLFAVVNGTFMQRLGANMLFLFPEYLGRVDALSTAMVGAGLGIFIMTWNITTFILHARYIKFLATTTRPFLKYCLNNAIIPLVFLGFYLFKAVNYQINQELLPGVKIIWLSVGFMAGFATAISIGLGYFFGADFTIYRNIPQSVKEDFSRVRTRNARVKPEEDHIRVTWFFSSPLKLRRPRQVGHYSAEAISRILKQHHLSAIFSLMLAFAGLITSGYFLDNKYFQLPAAASITVFFAILLAAASAFSYFLKSWSILAAFLTVVVINVLYQQNILDPRNKAYGLDYSPKPDQPIYNKSTLGRLASPENIAADSLAFITGFENWKRLQPQEKPVMVLVCVSGGGSRAATFTVNVMNNIDSVCQNAFMPATVLVSGASGGMMGAAWYRACYDQWRLGKITALQRQAYLPEVSGDLLNPLFSTFVARDLLSPPQFFSIKSKRYVKDRGYAFEQELNEQMHGWMNRSISSFRPAEDSGVLPRFMMNAVITRDGRKLIIGSRPARFMMRPAADVKNRNSAGPDGVDFISYFAREDAANMGMLSALRMNATFPYVLPNVWLPSQPVIDVMDAGFRDNTGLEAVSRFLYFFHAWINANCSRVILIQIRDKTMGGWDSPYESENVFDLVTKPALLTQANLFRFQEYAQSEQLQWLKSLYGPLFTHVMFQYIPQNKDAAAALSFHLTKREKLDLKAALYNAGNQGSFKMMKDLLK